MCLQEDMILSRADTIQFNCMAAPGINQKKMFVQIIIILRLANLSNDSVSHMFQ